MMVSDINVPIRVHDRRHANHESTTEFWNFKESVHHDAFIVPSVCNQEDAVYEDVTIKNGQEGMRRFRPKGSLPMTF